MTRILCSLSWDQAIKVVTGRLDVDTYHFHLAVRIACSDHDVSAVCEFINIASEVFVLNNHWIKVVVGLHARKFELFDDVRNFLKSMIIFMLLFVMVWNHQECRLFEKHHFTCIDVFAESLKALS